MTGIFTDILARVDAIIQSNLSNENFTVELLSKELKYSYTHTYRIIQEASDLTPSKYIRHIRLNQACHYLKETDLTINQVAFKVGFKTQSYFSAKFSEYKDPKIIF